MQVPKARAALVLAVGVMLATAGAANRNVDMRVADGDVAVGYATPAALAEALGATHARLVRDVRQLRIAEVRGVDVRVLRRLAGIRFVQRVAPRPTASDPALSTAAASPEWQMRATHGDAVPGAVLRSAAAVTIAVVDTGADVTAPDIAAKEPSIWNTRTGSADVRDANGHGTFVASIAAGSVTDGDGIAGAGGDAGLLIVKSVGDGGSFSDVDEAAGITYAVDHGARIVNLSVGGPTTTRTERGAVQYAINHGALVVAAVGNEYGSGNPVEYPAALLQPVGSNGVGGAGLAVTASTRDGHRAAFANTGSWISIAAPGEHVFGAVSQASSPLAFPRTPLAGSTTGLYGYASGTSFAAPQVSGAAALVWAANPALRAQEVAQILKETASAGGRWTSELGFGIVDVAAAVKRAQAGTSGVLLSGLQTKSRVKLNWSGDAFAYTLRSSTDGRAARNVLAATRDTSTSVALKPGHTYSFTVAALDAYGARTATSPPLTITVR